jgi:nitrate/nitrite transporter NarK
MAFSPDLLKMATQNNPFGAMPNNIDPKTLVLSTGIIFGLISLTGAIGGAAIVMRRGYALAVLGSCTALINISDCCCVLSAPVGITCLILLFQPHVKASFR